MEEYLLRLSMINFNQILNLLKSFDILHKNDDLCDNKYLNENKSTVKEYYLQISEELEHYNLSIKFNALAKLLTSFIKNPEFNFMLSDRLDDNFDLKLIEKAMDVGLLHDLAKNLSYFLSTISEFSKDVLNLKKLKVIFFLKINIFLLFLMLYFNRRKTEIKNFIKYMGDELEDTILRFIKLSPTYKYIPNRNLLCLHYIYIKILTSEENEENDYTCRKIEKKEKNLNRNNLDNFLKPKVPKYFYDYEKANKYLEKFYRKNMLKREKSDTERIIIFNVLKILLSTTDNSNNSNQNSGEYIKDYVPEMILYHYYVCERNPTFINESESEDKESLEISPKYFNELISNLPAVDQEMCNIIELLNKVSLTAIIISFYFYILRALQKFDLIQYTVFAFHLIESNGLLVFLKILNQDYKAIEQQFINIYDTDIINIQFGQLIEVILLNNLKLIYKICYKNDEFIQKYLVECKVYIMLKKVLNNFPENEKIKLCCLKLFKSQLKFYDKNWRVENINIITSLYLTLKLKPENEVIDNYLKYERKDKNSKEISQDYFTFEELKKVHWDYHSYNYMRFINNSDEFEKYQNSVCHSLYASIYLNLQSSAKLPEDFHQNYKNYIDK